MCYIEICNIKDRSPGSFTRQTRLKNVEYGSRFYRRQWECDKNSQMFKFKRIHFVYHITDFFQKHIFYVDEHEAKIFLDYQVRFPCSA